VAGPRRGDRVDPLADVVDLVYDVRPRMQEHRPAQGRPEWAPGEGAIDGRQGGAGEDGDDRGGIGERPEDLPGRAESSPDDGCRPELAVIRQADRDRTPLDRPAVLGRRQSG